MGGETRAEKQEEERKQEEAETQDEGERREEQSTVVVHLPAGC